MSFVTLLTMIFILGVVWGGLIICLSIAVKQEGKKR